MLTLHQHRHLTSISPALVPSVHRLVYTMADIQNVVVTSTQTVTQPKPHTTYTIQGESNVPDIRSSYSDMTVSTPIRTWTVSRRYNDFVALHAELKSSTGKEPPATLPPKHKWTITRSVYDEKASVVNVYRLQVDCSRAESAA